MGQGKMGLFQARGSRMRPHPTLTFSLHLFPVCYVRIIKALLPPRLAVWVTLKLTVLTGALSRGGAGGRRDQGKWSLCGGGVQKAIFRISLIQRRVRPAPTALCRSLLPPSTPWEPRTG